MHKWINNYRTFKTAHSEYNFYKMIYLSGIFELLKYVRKTSLVYLQKYASWLWCVALFFSRGVIAFE